MGELLVLLKTLYAQAPPATLSVGHLSLLLGVFGISIACVRGVYLHLVTKKLRAIVDDAGTGAIESADAGAEGALDDRWKEMLGVRFPRAFHNALRRMTQARRRPIGGPEEAWRSVYELVLADESRWETLVRGIASGAVLVGLFGTILGFADISGGLIPVSDESASQNRPAAQIKGEVGGAEQSESIAKAPRARENRDEGLQGKLAGVFIATLFGIFTALSILLVGAPLLRAAADQWLSAVEEAGLLVVIPALPRPPTRIQDILLEELQRRLSTVASAWESSLRGPAALLTEAADNSRRSVDAATKAFDGLRVSIDDLKALGQSANRIRTAAQSIEATAKVYADASKGLGAAVKSLEATLPALTVELRSLVVRLAGLEGALVSGTRSVAESGDTLREVVAKMGADFHGLQDAVASRQERESAFLAHTEQVVQLIRDRLNSLAAVEQAIKVQAGEMNMAVASVGLAVGKSLDPLHQSIAEAIRETLGELLKTHVDGLAATLMQIRQDAAVTAELLEKIRSGREGLLSATGEIVTRANVLTERGKELDHVAQQVSALLSALDRLSSSVHQLTQSGVIAHPEPDFLTALRRMIEESRVANVSELAVSLAQVQSSVSRVEDGVSRLRVRAEGPKREPANSFFRKTWARLRRSDRGRSG